MIARMLCVIIILISCAALFGWYKDIPALHSVLAGFPPMVPNTSLFFLLCAISFWLLLPEEQNTFQRRMGKLLAFCCVLLNCMTIVAYLHSVPASLILEKLPVLFEDINPFLLLSSPHTAISFIFSGMALYFLSSDKTMLRNLSQWLALGAALLSIVVLIGYIYGQKSFYIYTNIIGMSIPTAVAFIMLVLGMLLARPNAYLMHRITGNSVGSKMLRRLLPAVVFVPLVLGWLIVMGNKDELYSLGFGMAVFVVLTLLVLVSVIAHVARILNQEQKLRSVVEDELRDSELRMHEFALHLQNVREEERAIMAHNIHDDIGGMLAALKMDINLMSSKLKHADAIPAIHKRLDEMKQRSDLLMQSVRRIITNLRPSILDNLGLLEAIEWQLMELENRYGIEYHFDRYLEEEQIEFEDEGHLANVFRIFQEIMTNIIRHADASKVTVLATIIDATFVLSASDNGCGMDAEHPSRADAFGLIGIQERVRSMKGAYHLISKKDYGTTVIISVPIHV